MIFNPFDGGLHKWDFFSGRSGRLRRRTARALTNSGRRRIGQQLEPVCADLLQCRRPQAIVAGARDDAELYRLVTGASTEGAGSHRHAAPPRGPFLERANRGCSAPSAPSRARRSKPSNTPHGSRRSPSRCGNGSDTAPRQAPGARRGTVHAVQGGKIAALSSVDFRLDANRYIRGHGSDRTCERQHAGGLRRSGSSSTSSTRSGEIDGLKDALARLRKFGGRCILGFQSHRASLGHVRAGRCPHDH